jgi:hypothetical protein
MNRLTSDCLVLALSKEIEHLSSYQNRAIERTFKSISPTLRVRLTDDLQRVHNRLMEIHQSVSFLNIRRLSIGSRLLYEQSKRATVKSTSLRLTCS